MREQTIPLSDRFTVVQAAAWQRAAQAYRAGLPHLVVATIAISGLAYIQQLAIASMLAPGDFGVVRTVEALLLVLLLFGACGMPTVAVRFVPELADTQRGALLRRLLLMTLCVSVALALLTVAATFLVPAGVVGSSLRGIVWVIVFAALSRVIYNYHQGILSVRGISAVAALLALLSLLIVIGSVARWGRDGWIMGRVVGEALFLGGLLLFARRAFNGPSTVLPRAYDASILVRFGLTVTFSLALRSAMDASGLFILHAAHTAPDQTGYFGLGTLLLTAVLLLPAGFGALLLPRMVVRRMRNTATREYLLAAVGWALALTLPLLAGALLLVPLLLPVLLPRFADAVPLVTLLLLIAPLRAAAAMAGNQLLAASRVGVTIALNAAALILFVPLALSVAREFGVIGVAVVSIGVEGLLALATLLVALRSTRASAAAASSGTFAVPVA